MKKKIAAVIALVLLICITATGCTEANQVSYNISKEADNFNVTRKLTVLNARYHSSGADRNIRAEKQ